MSEGLHSSGLRARRRGPERLRPAPCRSGAADGPGSARGLSARLGPTTKALQMYTDLGTASTYTLALQCDKTIYAK